LFAVQAATHGNARTLFCRLPPKTHGTFFLSRCRVFCLEYDKLSTAVRSSKTVKLLFYTVHVKLHTANIFAMYLSKIQRANIFTVPIFAV
jgi:hypothetical protein